MRRQPVAGPLAWILPGMRLKRWISLALAGILMLNGGVALTVIEFMRPGLRLGLLGLLGAALGIIVMTVGLVRLIAEVVGVLQPDTDVQEALYQNRARKRGPRLVAIGGGTGLSTLLRGLKSYSDNITAIVTVADDGGSSGRLRQELGVLPPGDIRNCLVALSGEEHLVTELFRFRFPGESGLGGHAFGNLFLAALSGIAGDLLKAIQYAGRMLAVRGKVLPATLAQMTLVARFESGRSVRGESRITAQRERIAELWCEPAGPAALPQALKAIAEADAVILGPGSLYTSLLPHLLIPELREALAGAEVPKLYVCNVMTQPGETERFTAADHARVLQAYGGRQLFDAVLVNAEPPSRLLDRYEAQGQYPVVVDAEALERLGVVPVEAPLIEEREGVRHDPARLAAAVMTWYGSLAAPAGGPPRRPVPLG